MTLSERIKVAMDRVGMKAARLAREVGVKPPSVSNWITGETKSLSGETVVRAAKALGVNPRWLGTGEGPMEEEERDWSDIKGFSQRAALGDGAEAAEWEETHKLKFRADSLQRKHLRPDTLRVFYGKGDSMLPRIRSGDAILFDASDTSPRDQKLFVIQSAGPKGPEYSAKRCLELGGMVFFESLNPEADHNWKKPRLMTDPKKPIIIIGRIRWIGSWED